LVLWAFGAATSGGFGCHSGAIRAAGGRWSGMTKPRTGTMTERSPRHWRLQVAGDPDLITGEGRRLSRTIVGTRSEAKEALQRLVVEAGAGLHGNSGTTVGVLLEMFMATATLAPSTRADWESVVPSGAPTPHRSYRRALFSRSAQIRSGLRPRLCGFQLVAPYTGISTHLLATTFRTASQNGSVRKRSSRKSPITRRNIVRRPRCASAWIRGPDSNSRYRNLELRGCSPSRGDYTSSGASVSPD
jgi:hypothetical protein